MIVTNVIHVPSDPFAFSQENLRFLAELFQGAADELLHDTQACWYHLPLARTWLSAFSSRPLRNVPQGNSEFRRYIIIAAVWAHIWPDPATPRTPEDIKAEFQHLCHLFDVAVGLTLPEPGEPEYTQELREFCRGMAVEIQKEVYR